MKLHWLLFVIGILFIIGGLVFYFFPSGSYLMMTYFFSITLLSVGIIDLFYSIVNYRLQQGSGFKLLLSILDILLASLFLLKPTFPLTLLPYLFGFWLLFKSISSLAFATEMRKLRIGGWAFLLTLSVISIIVSLMLLWNPYIVIGLLLVFLSISFISLGVFYIVLGFGIKNISI